MQPPCYADVRWIGVGVGRKNPHLGYGGKVSKDKIGKGWENWRFACA